VRKSGALRDLDEPSRGVLLAHAMHRPRHDRGEREGRGRRRSPARERGCREPSCQAVEGEAVEPEARAVRRRVRAGRDRPRRIRARRGSRPRLRGGRAAIQERAASRRAPAFPDTMRACMSVTFARPKTRIQHASEL
jgi:hypothetical protein